MVLFLPSPEDYISRNEAEEGDNMVDYDIDELDIMWIDLVTKKRKFKGTVGGSGYLRTITIGCNTVHSCSWLPWHH